MKREIKFRGIRKDNGEFIEGDIIRWKTWSESPYKWTEHFAIVTHQWCNMEPNKWHEVLPETVGQYTGLKDKNGVEIFEGDIVKNWQGGWNVVVYKGAGFEATVSVNQSCLYTLEWWDTVEIIGNIHLNPELLTK